MANFVGHTHPDTKKILLWRSVVSKVIRHFYSGYATLKIMILQNIKRYYLFSYNINSLFILLMLSKKVNIIINNIYIGVSQNLVSLHTYYIFLLRQRLKDVITFMDFFIKRFSFSFFLTVAGREHGIANTTKIVRYGSERVISYHSQDRR